MEKTYIVCLGIKEVELQGTAPTPSTKLRIALVEMTGTNRQSLISCSAIGRIKQEEAKLLARQFFVSSRDIFENINSPITVINGKRFSTTRDAIITSGKLPKVWFKRIRKELEKLSWESNVTFQYEMGEAVLSF